MTFDPKVMALHPAAAQKNASKDEEKQTAEEKSWNIERAAMLKQFRELNDQIQTQKLVESEKESNQKKEVIELSNLVSTLKKSMREKPIPAIVEECTTKPVESDVKEETLEGYPHWWRQAFFLISLIVILYFISNRKTEDDKIVPPTVQFISSDTEMIDAPDSKTASASQRPRSADIMAAEAEAESNAQALVSIREKNEELLHQQELSNSTIIKLNKELSVVDIELKKLASQKLQNGKDVTELEERIKSEQALADTIAKEREELKTTMKTLSASAEQRNLVLEKNKTLIADLTIDRDELKRKTEDFASAISAERSKAELSAFRIKELEIEVARHQESDEAAKQLLSTIRSQRDDLLKLEVGYEQRIVELQGQLLRLNSEAETLQALKIEYEVKIEELESRVRVENELVEHLTEERNQLMASKTLLDISFAKQSTWAEGSKKLLVELQSDRDHLHKKSLGLEVVLRSLRLESENKITDLEKQLSAQGIKKAECDRELLVLMHEKRDELVMTEEISNIYIQLRKKNTELLVLQGAKNEADNRVAELEDIIQKDKSQVQELVAERDRLAASTAELSVQYEQQTARVRSNTITIDSLKQERDDLVVTKAVSDEFIKDLTTQVEKEKAQLQHILLTQEVRDNENLHNLQCLQEVTERKGFLEASAGELKDQVGELEAQRDRLRVKAAHARFGVRQEGVISKPSPGRSSSNSAFDLFSNDIDGSVHCDDDEDFELSDSDSDNSGVGMGIYTDTNNPLNTSNGGQSCELDLSAISRASRDPTLDQDPARHMIVSSEVLTEGDKVEKQKNRAVRRTFKDLDTVTVSDEEENANSNIDSKQDSTSSSTMKAVQGVNQVTPDKEPYAAFTSMFYNSTS